MHPYPFPEFPGSPAVERSKRIFSPLYGGKPVMATETGYHTGGPNSDRPVSRVGTGVYRSPVFRELQCGSGAILFVRVDG